jgi:hypothetical protein
VTFIAQPISDPRRLTRLHNAHAAEFGVRIAVLFEAIDPELRSNSMRALRADWRVFRSWAAARKVRAELPCEPHQLKDFVEAMRKMKGAATVIRYLRSISKLHRLAAEVDPCASLEIVRAMSDLHQARLEDAQRPRNADGHPWLTSSGVPDQACIAAMISTGSGHDVPDTRNRALLLLAGEGRYIPSELVALNWHDIVACDDSSTGETGDMA